MDRGVPLSLSTETVADSQMGERMQLNWSLCQDVALSKSKFQSWELPLDWDQDGVGTFDLPRVQRIHPSSGH